MEWRSSRYVWLAALAGCTKQLPPAPIPQPVLPPVQAGGSPAPGQARLIVDVVETPVPVQSVVMEPHPLSSPTRTTYQFVETPHVLCPQTPCVADVPQGNVLLGFPVLGTDDLEVELVNVGPDPSVYRRSLSIYTDNTGTTRTMGIISTALGGTALVAGSALLPIGIAHDSTGMTWAGGINLGAGALLLTLGILAINADAPTFRPGSANHFSPTSP